jgi:membrane dipeptidase
VRSVLIMPLIVDSHCDLAWNIQCFGRDYTLAVGETRRREQGSRAVEVNEETLIGYPEYQKGNVALIFGTLYAAPNRHKEGIWDKLCYSNFDEAHKLYWDQLDTYDELVESHPDKFRLIQTQDELAEHLGAWAEKDRKELPVGLVVLMEGADGVRSPDELAEWHRRGVRLIGLAWGATRYSGGTKEPGPLTAEGRALLPAMAELRFVLDLSHMDEIAALEALDRYDGRIVASHVNCLALLPGFPTNRHFSDIALRRIIERGGVIGNLPVNSFLKAGWSHKTGSRREEISLDTYVAHIDHVCQLAGDSLHSGIGSDFDGGFGLQSVPPEIDSVADLQKVAPALERRGYTSSDVENIMGLNWVRVLQTELPEQA